MPRSIKQKAYANEALIHALANGLDSKSAAKQFGVPASTIRDHRRVLLRKFGAGRPTYLSADHEALCR
jgi:DNA-binding NarL/FixJ family response regulator